MVCAACCALKIWESPSARNHTKSEQNLTGSKGRPLGGNYSKLKSKLFKNFGGAPAAHCGLIIYRTEIIVIHVIVHEGL